MSKHVHLIAEFRATKNNEKKLFDRLTELYSKTLKKEVGCLKYSLNKQIAHPNAPGTSKYALVAIEEFIDKAAFDLHCQSEHVAEFIDRYVDDKDIALVEEMCVRLFIDA